MAKIKMLRPRYGYAIQDYHQYIIGFRFDGVIQAVESHLTLALAEAARDLMAEHEISNGRDPLTYGIYRADNIDWQ